MILLIDNYDSFTWNLYQYFCELGAEVLVRRNDALTLEEIAALAPEKIVISPGPCTPDEAGISLAVIRHYAGKTPLLGVCLGHQAIAQAFGATIVRAAQVMHGKTSLIEHNGEGVFQGLNNPAAPAVRLWGSVTANGISRACSFIRKASSASRAINCWPTF